MSRSEPGAKARVVGQQVCAVGRIKERRREGKKVNTKKVVYCTAGWVCKSDRVFKRETQVQADCRAAGVPEKWETQGEERDFGPLIVV